MRPLRDWPVVLRAPVLGLGLGALGGALEATKLAATLKLSVPFVAALELALSTILLDALLGVGLGVFGGVGAHLLARGRPPAQRYALAMALTAVGLGCWFLWPAAGTMHEQGRLPAAIAFALIPVGIGGVVGFNALYWLRREELGESRRFGWFGWSLVASLVVGVAAAGGLSQREVGGSNALETDPHVLFITIDTMRWDHMSAYGQSPVQTPVLDALAAEGIRFDQAITPLPETGPAHAAMFTGRHPLRNGMLSNGHHLADPYLTLAEIVADEGYATGAFVSSFAVDSRTGLDQGFEIYDDDFFPWVRGVSEVLAVQWGLRVWMRFGDPLKLPWLLERPAPATYERATEWMEKSVASGRPFFAWVHTFDPHSPYEPHGMPGFEDNGTPEQPSVDHRWILANEADFTYTDEVREGLRRLYAEEIAYSDRELGLFLDRVRALDPSRPMLIVLTADHGEMLGEHGIEFNHHGIWDETVRVPLIVVPVNHRPMSGEAGKVVPHQVRVMDLFATVLDQLKLDPREDVDGFDVVKFSELPDQRSYATLLMGRKTASLTEGTVYGYRAVNKETGEPVKYMVDPDLGTESLFELDKDPTESMDISADHPPAVLALRERVEKEVGQRFDLPDPEAPLGDLEQLQRAAKRQQQRKAQQAAQPAPAAIDNATQERLEALGYVE